MTVFCFLSRAAVRTPCGLWSMTWRTALYTMGLPSRSTSSVPACTCIPASAAGLPLTCTRPARTNALTSLRVPSPSIESSLSSRIMSFIFSSRIDEKPSLFSSGFSRPLKGTVSPSLKFVSIIQYRGQICNLIRRARKKAAFCDENIVLPFFTFLKMCGTFFARMVSLRLKTAGLHSGLMKTAHESAFPFA